MNREGSVTADMRLGSYTVNPDGMTGFTMLELINGAGCPSRVVVVGILEIIVELGRLNIDGSDGSVMIVGHDKRL